MPHVSERHVSIKHALTSSVFIMILIYFCYHAMNGQGGLFSLVQLSQTLDEATIELETIRSERIRLANRTMLLKGNTLDLDLLDEQVRRNLAYADKEETVLNY